MYRFLLTPRWWGINAFVALAIPFCIFMGTWQLDRFEDRVDSHQEAKKAPAPSERAAVPLTELLPVDKRTAGRPATASGVYGKQFRVPDRQVDGERGDYVLTLLKTDGGPVLPVVRGWVPKDDPLPAAPSGEVTVTGVLQPSEHMGTDGVHSTGGLPAGQLGMISAASLVNLVPDEVHNAWITLMKADADMVAVPPVMVEGSGLDLKAFQNLGYTGEWFVFAAFMLFMWFRLVRREAEEFRDRELGLTPDPAA
ncbi:SURF1 family protein [Streptomyces yaizuensis]|uniref:SURF1-like protein n=1 Tax=Streptomyces yaizuensis TaxID=2989713 RepID=A0ABQ5P033_9ACTN|nr:SURF1 family protein [Streptomyces sp. YSPA8]GLF95956.1 SURF1 family protein [Streptomyces sp. YSPA8]